MILKVVFANNVDPDQTSLIRVQTDCLYAKIGLKKFARIFSRRHKQTTFSDAGFLGILRVKIDITVFYYSKAVLLLKFFIVCASLFSNVVVPHSSYLGVSGKLCFVIIPVSILYKSITGRYRPVSYPDGLITARYRFIKNASWDVIFVYLHLLIY